MKPVIWLNQTKGLRFVSKQGTKMTQGNVNDFVRSQSDAAISARFGSEYTHQVYDLFTTQLVGSDLKSEKLPAGCLLTTLENFDRVVGPAFAPLKYLLQEVRQELRNDAADDDNQQV